MASAKSISNARVYLDANASSSMRPAVKALLRETLDSSRAAANPSSVHSSGRKARASLRKAREALLDFLEVPKESLVFTSGGTEACNMMIGGFLGSSFNNIHIITSPVEHAAVTEVLLKAETQGAEISKAAIDPSGRILVRSVVDLLQKNTALVCLMTANNETGVIQPIAEIATALRGSGFSGLIVSDFTQVIGKSDVKVSQLFEAGVDAVAISGHKIGALSGVGALVYRKSDTCRFLDSIILGGPQEKGFRGGTENLLGALSFGAAAAELKKTQSAEIKSRIQLREFFWNKLSDSVPSLKRYGSEPSLSNTLLVGFEGCNGGDLVASLDISGVEASTGSACSSGKQGVSETVKAIETDEDAGREVVRFSIDWCTVKEDIETAVSIISTCVFSMRELRSLAGNE